MSGCAALRNTPADATRLRVPDLPALVEERQFEDLANVGHAKPVRKGVCEPTRNSGVQFRANKQLEGDESCAKNWRSLRGIVVLSTNIYTVQAFTQGVSPTASTSLHRVCR